MDEIQEAIEGMSQIFIVDDEIWKIITEEADAYFYGDADPWQVAKNIQNRVSLFVSESR